MTAANVTLKNIIESLHLTVLTEQKDFAAIRPTSGYTSDMLSCVMAGAQHDGVWITLQAHNNIVAVAAMLGLSAVIITEDAQPEATTIQKANQEEVVLLSTTKPSFDVAGRLWEMGLRAE